MDLQKYLNENLIIQIGCDMPGCVATDAIVSNPHELLTLLEDSCFFVSEILWWDRVKIHAPSAIGSGGVRDPRCPQEYIFLETWLLKEFDGSASFSDYQQYCSCVVSQYPSCDLYPSFTIRLRG